MRDYAREFYLNQEFKVGDIVMYGAAFLRSAGIYTGPLPFDTGEVLGVEPFGEGRNLVEVEWLAQGRGRVLHTNLIRSDRRHLEPR